MHFYADDTQLCIGFNPATEHSIVISKIERCLNCITSFMKLNYFKIKLMYIFLAKPRILSMYPVSMDIGSQKFTSTSTNRIKTQGVTINQGLSCIDKRLQCLRSCQFYLFKLRQNSFI